MRTTVVAPTALLGISALLVGSASIDSWHSTPIPVYNAKVETLETFSLLPLEDAP